ncbi:lipid-A-disaccharide synthase N-terminal domain-containing protein [Kiloniella majae]|uniref:lipid-A-disaccharide synthase N-terminal domain-containing protein n=1 Tax=Kiloniella majae TaxID=1938558 RepID=UPI000A278AE5|nr:lipid-A-disaccharide synthase N-terminal domain-containing protein [Kiloniella majae]
MNIWTWFQQLTIGEAIGLIGGGIFFCSWILQAWESRKAGKPTVSKLFFILRSAASLLMAFEAFRVGSVSIFIVMIATLILMLYNVTISLEEK